MKLQNGSAPKAMVNALAKLDPKNPNRFAEAVKGLEILAISSDDRPTRYQVGCEIADGHDEVRIMIIGGVTITQRPCDDVPDFTQKGITGWQE